MDDRSHDSERESAQDATWNTVVCRVCGAENRASRLFCADCGTYLKGEDEDTWVDLPARPETTRTPGGPAPGAADPTWSAATPPSNPMRGGAAPPARPNVPPPPLAWDDALPPSHTAAGSTNPAARPPRRSVDPVAPTPPRKKRHWIFATFLVVLLLAAAGVTGAVAYQALVAPDPGPGDGGATGGSATTSTTDEEGTDTTSDTGPNTTSSTSTDSTTPTDKLGEPVDPTSTFASSTLPAEGENDYRDRNIADGRLSTAWSEGAEGAGVGEWVQLDLNGPTTLAAIEIANGYQKDERRFRGNPRVERLRVEYSDGSSRTVRLHDDMGFQIITASPTPTEWVRFVIESTYPGDTWEDASLSEVRLYRTH
ncbi:MAG: discoidin domain-containing protein [Thermoleophilia bacterium]